MVYVASRHPGDEVIAHYVDMLPASVRGDARARFEVVVVDDGSARAVAAKLLDDPGALDRVRAACGGRPGLIEPWNVDDDEACLALELGLPVNGCAPGLRGLGFKSAGRRLMRDAGVPVPYGSEDLHTPSEIVEAAMEVLMARPGAPGVVVKTDDSGAGDGNVVLRVPGSTGVEERRDALTALVEQLPAWYRTELRAGAVVEELIEGEEFSSPSAQIDVLPGGDVVVLATHEQDLGGDSGQVYEGCRFPARSEYAATLAFHARAVGERLASAGAVGRASVDFVAVRTRDRSWAVHGIEINLRKGGTTHPYTALRGLTRGRYDAGAGEWHLDDGTSRCYVATDHLVDADWVGLTPAAAVAAIRDRGLAFDPVARRGVVLHMLTGLGIDGRCGLTAIAERPEDAEAMREATRRALGAAAATRTDHLDGS